MAAFAGSRDMGHLMACLLDTQNPPVCPQPQPHVQPCADHDRASGEGVGPQVGFSSMPASQLCIAGSVLPH